MTSNIGSEILNKKENNIGFSRKNEDINDNGEISEETDKEINQILNKYFKKEFLNRIDEIVIFNKLTKEVIYRIINKYCEELVRKFDKIKYKINIKEEVKDFILKNISKESGARDVKRKIIELLEEKIIDKILENNIKEDSEITVEIKENMVEICCDIR